MAVFSNKQIREAIKSGHIICHPLVDSYIAGSSLDVTLGYWFYRTERTGSSGFYKPFDKSDVDRYFDGPYKAEAHEKWASINGRKLFKGIPPKHPIIVLRPGERILAHTHEFIGIKAPGTSTMQARSTWGRSGISACLDAGWGDPGYINRWTMEIYNMTQHEGVAIPVGERIAQMVFYETGPVEGEYAKLSGKYQSGRGTELSKIIKTWTPGQLLPRAYKDSRTMPLKIKCLKIL